VQLKLALPKGKLLNPTAAWLGELGLKDYKEGSRCYRLSPPHLPLLAKVFQERDIPIQVAIGNYDLGICGSDWVEELLAKYPESPLVKVKDLGYGRQGLYLASSSLSPFSSLEDIQGYDQPLRLASEYPHLMEAMALKLRLKRFKLFPLWGAAEVYPPEDAELILLATPSPSWLASQRLKPLTCLLTISAFLIANRNSWEEKDLGAILPSLNKEGGKEKGTPEEKVEEGELPLYQEEIKLALPDGHLQPYTLEFLRRAGLDTQSYAQGNRRPSLGLPKVGVKVIRPQDMPLQVAGGNFDLAITGKDWLFNHLYQFPSSPVEEVMDLGYGRVRIVAVVSRDLPINDVKELRDFLQQGHLPYLRLASEYVNIADKFARENHLSRYKIIPTWGASEAFLPEDADILIENTQTGQTLAQHNLKIIDTLFESSACIIAFKNSLNIKGEKMEWVIHALKRGLT